MQALLADPLAARSRHVLAFLFGGPQAFLLAGDVVTIQEAPQCGLAGANAVLAQLRLNSFQSRVGPLVDNRQYPVLVLLQRRLASATRLRRPTACIAQPLHPFDRRTDGDAKDFCRPVTSCDQSLSQVTRIGLRHCPALLRPNQCRQTRASLTLCESFRFKSTGFRSSGGAMLNRGAFFSTTKCATVAHLLCPSHVLFLQAM
jgi:hypothetical protein